MLRVELSTQAHVDYLAPRLRVEDVAEIRALGSTPKEALEEGLATSEPALSGVDQGGRCVIMFGACTHEPGLSAVLWMLSSDEIYRHRMQFLRASREYLDRFNDRWPVLFNVCDARNTDHIKWMRWLDYTFINRHERFGPEQRPFYEFVRMKKQCV